MIPLFETTKHKKGYTECLPLFFFIIHGIDAILFVIHFTPNFFLVSFLGCQLVVLWISLRFTAVYFVLLYFTSLYHDKQCLCIKFRPPPNSTTHLSSPFHASHQYHAFSESRFIIFTPHLRCLSYAYLMFTPTHTSFVLRFPLTTATYVLGA
jgi:hypothetical protein